MPSADPVGLCGVPDWAFDSHDAGGNLIAPSRPASPGARLTVDLPN